MIHKSLKGKTFWVIATVDQECPSQKGATIPKLHFSIRAEAKDIPAPNQLTGFTWFYTCTKAQEISQLQIGGVFTSQRHPGCAMARYTLAEARRADSREALVIATRPGLCSEWFVSLWFVFENGLAMVSIFWMVWIWMRLELMRLVPGLHGLQLVEICWWWTLWISLYELRI